MSKDERSLIDGFVAELAAVISAMLGAAVTPKATNGKGKAAKAADPWVVRVNAAGISKVLAVAFSRAAAGKLSARVMMMDERSRRRGDRRHAERARPAGHRRAQPQADREGHRVHDAAGRRVRDQRARRRHGLRSAGRRRPQRADRLRDGRGRGRSTNRACGARLPPRRRRRAGSRRRTCPENLDVILDIDLPLSVRFGHAELTLDALTKLGPGSLIELARLPDDPVELLVNGKLVARGEVVVVGGNYGVRVHEVVSAAERIRTLE